MQHFVRFAKFSPCGSIARSGWRLRLFATSNEASAFAEQVVGACWRVEVGTFDETEREVPGAFIGARSLTAPLARPPESASVGRRFGRA
jgi:hypothetical protein